MKVKIAIGVDHHAVELKTYLMQLGRIGCVEVSWIDVGCHNTNKCDYPPYGQEVARLVKAQEADYGILSCGTGIGMAVAANRFSGIFAGLVWNPDVARRAKEEDNVSVLVIPADYMDLLEAFSCIEAWLCASFKNEVERYQMRLDMIDN